MKTIIGFDFDGCLGTKQYIQQLAKCLILDKANEIHIITRRYGFVHPKYGDEVSQVLKIAKVLGICNDNIHFTNRTYKINKLIELKIDIHYDDDKYEIMLIRNQFPTCRGFLVF